MFTRGLTRGGGPFQARLRRVLVTAMFSTMLYHAANANATGNCSSDVNCAQQLDFLLSAEDQQKNADRRIRANDHGVSGPTISVDGTAIYGEWTPGATGLEATDIRVTFDGLGAERRLEISTIAASGPFAPGQPTAFHATWNYGAWIERAEVRLYRAVEKTSAAAFVAPVARIGIDAEGNAVWQTPAEFGAVDDLVYTLRVYDAQGRFDETAPVALRGGVAQGEREFSFEPRDARDRDQQLFIANIPVNGGKVSVSGKNVPPGYRATVLGVDVQVGAGGEFTSSHILPPGDHAVAVDIVPIVGEGGLSFERDIHIPQSEWFRFAVADLTIGKRFGRDSSLLTPAAPGEYDRVYRRGRLAFYLKGKVQGRFIITAAMDTREEELDRLFSNLDRKNPRQLLRRLDPDDYYPVYGDDSTTVEDAPTSGKFYVRIDNGVSHVMWGNFRLSLGGVELARYERGLYGAKAELKTGATTASGEAVASVTTFAAQPGTLPQRDEFRGTGGSAYFLRRQDITIGSEQLSVELRDRITGIAQSRISLVNGQDYEIDYIQGLVILKRPLASTLASDAAVKSGPLSGEENWLVAQYEYTPAVGDISGYSYGGRGAAWLGDHIRVSVTGVHEETGIGDQTLWGADLLLRLSNNSYIELEWAQSQGDGFASVSSTDGGFIFAQPADPLPPGPAEAWRVKAIVDLQDLGWAVPGRVGGRFEERQAGFSAPGRRSAFDERLASAFAEFGDRDGALVSARYDSSERSDGRRKSEATGEAALRFNQRWSVSVGVQRSEQTGDIAANDDNGGRTDAGLRLTRHLSETSRVWLSGQTTLARDGERERNDRIGVGAERELTDTIAGLAEVSWGTSGLGLIAGLNYEPDPANRYHFDYRLASDNSLGDPGSFDPFGRDHGAIVLGSTRKLHEAVAVFTEENLDLMGKRQSVTHHYGVTFTPEPEWKLWASAEAGEIRDEDSGDFNRIAGSGGLAYTTETLEAELRLEARMENGIDDATRDRQVYLASAHTGIRISPDWRFLAKVDAVLSQSPQDTILDGDFIEGSLGYAYRPAGNDRFNALLKYTYLYDLPGAEQLNANNQRGGPRQRSHVASVDFIYDLNKYLSVGGKYGIRLGEVARDFVRRDFVESTAQLAIARVDFHVVNNWDIIWEGRALWLSELDQIQFGALVGLYRHINNNLKIGVGYNFGRFSDDLTDLTLDDQGVFINVIGKF